LGVLPQAWRDPLHFFLDTALRYGDMVRLQLGPTRAYLLNHPDYIKHVLQDNHQNYRKSVRINRVKPLFGEGLTTSEGDLWRQQRRLLQPAFHRHRIAALATMMTDMTAMMLERWQRIAAHGQTLDIAAEMTHLTQHIMSATLCRTEVSGEAETVSHAMAIVEEELNHRVWALLALPLWCPTPRTWRLRHAIRTLDQHVYRLLDTRCKAGTDSEALLPRLLQVGDAATNAGIGKTQWRDEVMTLLFAGHATTAAALSWTWCLLAQHAAVQARLHIEVVTMLGERVPTASDLPALPYLSMILQEAMRLYPPAWITARTPQQDDEIGNFVIPAGTVVLLSPYVMHRHPRFWEQPTVFDPERFTAARSTHRPRYAYFPFGGGPRRCLGEHFALLEAQLIIAMVVQRYRLQWVPTHPVTPQPLLTLRPQHGILVTLHPYT
jgi:cytochrome P450